MDNRDCSKKGYILIELLIVLLIMSVLEIIFLPQLKEPKLNSYNFKNDYLLAQTIALVNNEKVIVDTGKYNINSKLELNSKANVNKAQSLNIDNHKIIITLGMGRIHE
jgi:competence protein ComGC